jgi:hypothetical protein
MDRDQVEPGRVGDRGLLVEGFLTRVLIRHTGVHTGGVDADVVERVVSLFQQADHGLGWVGHLSLAEVQARGTRRTGAGNSWPSGVHTRIVIAPSA